MTLADNPTLQATHASLMGPVRRLRRIAMTRRTHASFEQAAKIKHALSSGDKCVHGLMREQLRGACEMALEVLKETEGD